MAARRADARRCQIARLGPGVDQQRALQFAWGFDIEFYDATEHREALTEALAKFDRGEAPKHEPRVRRFSPSHLEQRRATRRATERGCP